MTRVDPMVAAAAWLLLMGVWPFADPGHSGDSPASLLDIALHVGALVFLIHWWVSR